MSFARLAILVSLAASQLGSAAFIKRTTCSTGQTTVNAACCKLFPIIDEMQKELFENGECGEDARGALRLVFHDAIGFSVQGGKGGGADGSILAFNQTETKYEANGGIDDITARQFPIFANSGLSAGDFLHLAGAVGTGNCPGAPKLDFFMGRPAPTAAAPDHTVPEPTDSVTDILARFADAGFSPDEAVALLSSHTIASASQIDKTIPGTPFDSTPATFDTQVFLEMLLTPTLFPGDGFKDGEFPSPMHGEMRLLSDWNISQDDRTACAWQDMINNQNAMMTKFKAAMSKLQLLGQTGLTDCSDVLPVPAAFAGPIKYPASFSQKNAFIACPSHPFPSVATVDGPAPTLPALPVRQVAQAKST